MRLAMLAVALLCGSADAKPAKPEKKPEPKPAELTVIDLSAKSSTWGTITQEGRRLKVDGHDAWFANGEIRPDGTVYSPRRDAGREPVHHRPDRQDAEASWTVGVFGQRQDRLGWYQRAGLPGHDHQE